METIGKVRSQPELRFTPTGSAVCDFKLVLEDGSFMSVNAWDELAEQVNENLEVGMRVRVFGARRTNEWTDKEGNKKEYEFINSYRVQILKQ